MLARMLSSPCPNPKDDNGCEGDDMGGWCVLRNEQKRVKVILDNFMAHAESLVGVGAEHFL